ncbi:MAG TPA: hypothetical protein VMH85_02670 [Terriglobales bacterium]|nr:hypothetical protein [Terriglobales bacterium]
MPEKQFEPARTSTIQCSLCPCGHVCLRWRRSLLLHLDDGEIVCALDCLREVLSQDEAGLSLGAGSFSACRAADGFYYLLCQDHIVLRLSQDEACTLQAELATAHATLGKASSGAAQIM